MLIMLIKNGIKRFQSFTEAKTSLASRVFRPFFKGRGGLNVPETGKVTLHTIYKQTYSDDCSNCNTETEVSIKVVITFSPSVSVPGQSVLAQTSQ